MARPRKDDDHRRTETVAFRVTPAERMQLEHAAIAAGLSASEYARRQTLKGRVVVQPRRALDHAAFDELRRIGVNLNQLARKANQTGHVPRELSRVCAALETILVREIEGHPEPETAYGSAPAAAGGPSAPPPRPDGPHGP